jgi:nucleoid DNA-binding protein
MAKNKDSCNNRIYKQVALKLNMSPSQVEEMFSVVCQFSVEIIQRGAMETVMLPNFGKLKVKEKQLQFLEQLRHELTTTKRTERGTDKSALDSHDSRA